MTAYSSQSIPNYVKAGSPIGLRRQMLMNNARLNAFVIYGDIQNYMENGKVVWIAWFMEPIKGIGDDPIFDPKAGE